MISPHLANACWYANHVTDGVWKPYHWARVVAKILAVRLAAGNARIIVNAPPRIGKSELCTKWTATRHLELNPQDNVVIASYGAELAAEVFGRQIRDEALANDRIGFQLRDDTKATHRWWTTSGGGLYSVGIGGAIVGRGFNLGLVDDPIKNWDDAQSWTKIQALRDWWRNVWTTRAEPGASMIVTHQRWHEDDPTGWLLEGGDRQEDSHRWLHLRLPAICDSADDLAGRQLGEALCPERYNVNAYKIIAQEVGEDTWEAQYQQAPKPVGVGSAYSHYGTWNVKQGIEPNYGEPLCLAVDWNINPGMHGVVGQYDSMADQFVVFDVIHHSRLPVVSVTHNGFSLVEMFVDRYFDNGKFKFPELHIYGDPSGHQSSIVSGQSYVVSLVDGLRQAGLNDWDIHLRIKLSAPRVAERVEATNQALKDTRGESHVWIDPETAGLLIHDLKNVRLTATAAIDKSNVNLTHATEAFGFWVEWQRPLVLESQDENWGRFGVRVT